MWEDLFKKLLIFVIIGFFIPAGFLPNITGNIAKVNEIASVKTFNETSYSLNRLQNDADLPVWNIGDSWTYNVDFEGKHGTNVNFDISIRNLKFEVVDVQSDIYRLSYNVNTGDITGNIIVDIDILTLSGDLRDTWARGNVKVDRSDLNILNGTIDIDGYIDQIVDIHFISHIWMAYYKWINEELKETKYFVIKFPLNVGDEWSNSLTYMGFYLEEGITCN